ncbi:peptidoglycan DD-metalloendopeptidase family protein [Mucilaginibacter sp. RS28]|uniref:Peptidoglycan DD-metalloendopeptidase family protein n=1 Tax=Mucilaginibacter straminoryzae TaxID=2932774 RepID=A0A9X2BDU0_9SPHI|nr:peptidoglycan DD-metalloendopeptidase family protein [Mucilaginibacter straminoryzae]MCJ8210693.1 peptidoglycan DD-metalloendopeptidase family protein [Mucilaginibacter straminoryzae]
MKFIRALIVCLLVLIAAQSWAQSSAELKRKREQLNRELQQLNDELRETQKNKKTTLKELNNLKAQISLREDKINNLNAEIRLLGNQINQNTNTVHTLQSQLDQLKKEYAAMIVFAYHNQSAYNKLMFIFASKDFNQAYKRLKYLQQFGNYRERQAASIQGTQHELNNKISELDRTKKEQYNLLEDQEKEKETLGKQKNDQLQVISNLSKQQGEINKQIRDGQRQMAQIDRQIRITIRREIEEARRQEEARLAAQRAAEAKAAAERAKAAGTAAPVASNRPAPKSTSSNSELLNATPEAAKLSNDFLGNRGRLPWPVANGVITQEFGMNYIEGIKTDNPGIDIRTGANAAVRAIFSGEVTSINNISGTYLVVIRHGEYFTAYANLKSVSVSKGAKVDIKQTLGTVATDAATGETQVHFELYKGQTAVNPKIWLAPQ